MDPQAPDTDVKTQARRRLLRGSFSVPAVLAVHNGSALAAASNKFLCAVKATTGSGNAAPAPAPAPDNWTRVSVYEVVESSTVTKFYVRTGDLQAIANSRNLAFVTPAGTDTGWVAFVAGGLYQFAPTPANTPSPTSVLTAVLFDNVGTAPNQTVRVVGFVQPGAPGTAPVGQGAISASCWTSIKP